MILSRQEAIEKGEKFYCTGIPCKYGHLSERYRSGVCVECQRVRNRSKDKCENYGRVKEWRVRNPHLRAEQHARHYDKNRARVRKYGQRMRAAYRALKELGIEIGDI